MTDSDHSELSREADFRFPSGPWKGFFLQAILPPGRHEMDLHLAFRQGKMWGEGADRVGRFVIVGQYSVEDGKCHWDKRYTGRHTVRYAGYNEGKGIWGTWHIPGYALRGGFHIWPREMGDPTKPTLAEAIDEPNLIAAGVE